jgi:hypothetical protein
LHDVHQQIFVVLVESISPCFGAYEVWRTNFDFFARKLRSPNGALSTLLVQGGDYWTFHKTDDKGLSLNWSGECDLLIDFSAYV